MRRRDFEAQVARRHEQRLGVLLAKEKEYARSQNRLWNFKRAADVLNREPIQAAVGMWAKHLVSVLDMCDAVAAGSFNFNFSPAMLDEKMNDMHNYLDLIEAIINDSVNDKELPITEPEVSMPEPPTKKRKNQAGKGSK